MEKLILLQLGEILLFNKISFASTYYSHYVNKINTNSYHLCSFILPQTLLNTEHVLPHLTSVSTLTGR